MQYSCDGRGLLEVREGGTVYMTRNVSTGAVTYTLGMPGDSIKAISNHFPAHFDLSTGSAKTHTTHPGFNTPR